MSRSYNICIPSKDEDPQKKTKDSSAIDSKITEFKKFSGKNKRGTLHPVIGAFFYELHALSKRDPSLVKGYEKFLKAAIVCNVKIPALHTEHAQKIFGFFDKDKSPRLKTFVDLVEFFDANEMLEVRENLEYLIDSMQKKSEHFVDLCYRIMSVVNAFLDAVSFFKENNLPIPDALKEHRKVISSDLRLLSLEQAILSVKHLRAQILAVESARAAAKAATDALAFQEKALASAWEALNASTAMSDELNAKRYVPNSTVMATEVAVRNALAHANDAKRISDVVHAQAVKAHGQIADAASKASDASGALHRDITSHVYEHIQISSQSAGLTTFDRGADPVPLTVIRTGFTQRYASASLTAAPSELPAAPVATLIRSVSSELKGMLSETLAGRRSSFSEAKRVSVSRLSVFQVPEGEAAKLSAQAEEEQQQAVSPVLDQQGDELSYGLDLGI